MNESGEKLQNHVNKELDERIKWLEDHYNNFNAEFGSVKSNVEWLIWGFRWLLAGVGGTMFFALLNLVITLILRK